jgi:N-acetylmuramate 1-kinase
MTDRQLLADADAHERIAAYLELTGLSARRPQVVSLTGDASDRRYFRVLAAGSEPIVLALHSGPIEFATMPFANVADLLARMAIPTPTVLGHIDALGIIALEDLGDVTLQSHVGAGTITEHFGLYREAVALIHELQQRGRAFSSSDYVPYTLAFDVAKLTFELDFFTTHFLEGYHRVTLSPSERSALAAQWAVIAGELATEPRVLCHRDYHSRNLMLHGGRLRMIDFQDARLGPDTYDLVSLLRDSYVDITDVERDSLIVHFAALSGVTDGIEFRRRFDLMAVQRNLKALGTFGFQASARGNASYVQYMPRTLGGIRANFHKHARFGQLRDLLGVHLEELR